ncbi:sphingomyelin phosphodiesterase [Mytilinidion resinicola]|uniref:Sphingomyelin phosphodiesterase n=1 Tax=Mytilinidion resinicola TaxID=574789 RepID=A0A6A6Z3B9_9PEZI|nr:sphingomyelin phosphodiesterase [Mytilinidion resinicola]KAF2814655.1 sphingomyelin phosphodiesterase [Mytilinidion resinicola]
MLRRKGEELINDIAYSFENGATCTACEAIQAVLKRLVKANESLFLSTMTELCKLAGEDPEVCEGAVAREGPIIAYALRQIEIGSKTSKLFCITFMGVCDYPEVTPYKVSFPKKESPRLRPAPSGETPIRIVQFSDIHVDRLYVPGTSTNCTTYICCRAESIPKSLEGADSLAGPNGNHHCDVPLSLETSMYRAIEDIGPSFSIFTGDIIDHAIWNTTQAQNTINIDLAYAEMSSLGHIYGTIGNHEADPVNSFPSTAVESAPQPQWIYDTLSYIWSRWIGDEAATAEKNFGAYSTKHPGTNLRIISLNTNLYYIQNYWLYQDPMEPDPSDQLSWLVRELQAAEDAGDRVYIIGHMPMGLRDTFHDYSNYFDQIVNRYEATVAAMFFGHTHSDEFELSYSSPHRHFSTAAAMSYIAPALTPNTGHPSFRLYTIDPATFAVLDSVTYIANMSAPDFQTTGPVWEKYYSAAEVYGPLVTPPLEEGDELSPAFWHNVTEAFERDQGAFWGYWERKKRGWEVGDCAGGEGACREREVCQVRAARAEDNCVVPKLGFHYEQMSEGNEKEGKVEEDVCGGSMGKKVFGALMGRKNLVEVLVGRVIEMESRV